MKHQTTTKGMTRVFSLLVLISLVAALAPAVPTAAGAAGTAPAAPDVQGGLLQFSVGGHVLGFAPEAAYLATGSHALRVGFVGANAVQPVGKVGASASPTGVQPLDRVTYSDLWLGITLTYEAAAGAVAKSTYHLAPGADAGQIQLAYNAPVQVQADGSLRLAFATGDMNESAPLAWQEIEGQRVAVAVAFTMRGQTVGFRLGGHDPRYPLTIDPSYVWHTFYGSSSNDNGTAIVVDSSGNVYVAGVGSATWQGDGSADPLHAHSGGEDIAVLKLDGDGAYQWHTFYGSSEWDVSDAIAVDGSGGVYVTGQSDTTWQGDGGASPLHPYSEGWDITVLKLDSAGTYQWHTFYGSSTLDRSYGIAVDGSGGVYVTGETRDTWQGDGGADPLHPYGADSGSDITVLKLDSDGAYQWHTFYGAAVIGSPSHDDGRAIAVDGSGGVYVTGETWDPWQGDGGADPLHPYSGGIDIIVLKLDSEGAYQWHTFYGSSSSEAGYAFAVDGSGGVYVTGYSSDTWLGDGGADPLHAHSGAYYDITVLKLDSEGAYGWHTFYGGSYDNAGYSIAVNGNSGVYVAGSSYTSWQGDGGADPLHPHSGIEDIVVLKLDSEGAYGWHTFYGSGDTDNSNGIAVDGSGGVYVAGTGWDTWQGDGGADPLHLHSGYTEITVVKLDGNDYGVSVTPPSDAALGDPGSDVVYTLNVTNTGTTTDTFDVSLDGNNWPTVAPLTIGPLESGVSATLGVTVSIPLGTPGGTSDTVVLICTSQNDNTVSGNSVLTTTAGDVLYVYLPLVVKNR